MNTQDTDFRAEGMRIGGEVVFTDNVIEVTGRGIVAGKGTSPTISGNTVCGGDVSIFVNDEATRRRDAHLSALQEQGSVHPAGAAGAARLYVAGRRQPSPRSARN